MSDDRPVDRPAAPVSVRPARPGEHASAGQLVADAYAAAGYAHGAYLDVLRDAAGRSAVAEVVVLVAVEAGGRVLGTVTYAAGGTPFADVAAPDEAEFRMLAVDSKARGRGVGEALVRSCLDRARANGKRRLVMSTQPGMTTAHRLYERLGFRRAPDRDWSPASEPGLRLRVYAREVAPFAADPAEASDASPETASRRDPSSPMAGEVWQAPRGAVPGRPVRAGSERSARRGAHGPPTDDRRDGSLGPGPVGGSAVDE